MDEDRHEKGQSVPSDVSVAENWTDALERIVARREGVSREAARPIVARKAGVTAGKIYSLARHRLKTVENSLLRGIGGALIRELQHELARIEHELAIHTQIGGRGDDGEAIALAKDRQKILEALGLTSLPPHEGEKP